MVPGAGIEPARLAAGDFESPASTNFTTRAYSKWVGIKNTYRGKKGKIIRVLRKLCTHPTHTPISPY